jgi:hypothetical protein
MAISFTELQNMLRTEGINFWVHPNEPTLMLGANAYLGSFQFVVNLGEEGTFLQLRAVNYHSCRADHPHLGAVLGLMNRANYQYGCMKLAWDPQDGEITMFVDTCLMDAVPTQAQLRRVFNVFVQFLDILHPRLQRVLETGEDPGEEYVQSLFQKMREGGGGPGEAGGEPSDIRDL